MIDVRIVLVDDPELVHDAVGLGHLEGRDVLHDVPEALEVLLHLTTATGDEALLGVAVAVEGAAGLVELLEDRDVLGRHLGVTDEEDGCRQCSDTRADQVCLALSDVVRGTGWFMV